MIFGKYGEMILENMEKNYPYRKQELEVTGELELKIYEREQYIIKKKLEYEKIIKEQYDEPNTSEMYIISKYQQMIEGLVDEKLMPLILEKI